LAIEIPEKVRDDLEVQLEEIKKQYGEFSWVSKENYHVTVYFLGETNEVFAIKHKISSLLYDSQEFFLYSFQADVFLNQKLLVYLTFRREKNNNTCTGKY